MVDFSLPLSEEHKFLGRRVIYTSREQINTNTIPSIVNGAMQQHLINRAEIDYLFRYFKGDQPILGRVKEIRPEINNRIVVNNAYCTVRSANGYFLGEPIQYNAKKLEDSNNIATLNDFMDSENKAYEDMKIGNDMSICGRGFRLNAVDDAAEEDEAPFEIPTLEPNCTEVVYSTKAGHPPVLAFTYNCLLNDDGSVTGTTFTVYDKEFQYIYTVKGGYNTQIQSKNLISQMPHFLGDVPIVEYPNNEWRIGDFEMVMTIYDAISKNMSDRENSIEQIVNSILVFIGCHLKTAEESKSAGGDGVSDLEQLKEYGAIELPSASGEKADVKYVTAGVNQNEAETLAQTLIDYAYAITGIPDRKTNANGSGGETGDAVYLRDGYQSLEVVARIKERNFKQAERTSLRMICRIIEKFSDIKLRPMQVEVKFVRNRTNNLLNKAQSAVNLQQTQLFCPEDIISLIGITENSKEMAKRGQDFWTAKADEEMQNAEKLAAASKQEPTSSTPKDNTVAQSAKSQSENSNGGNGYGGKMA